MRVHELAKELGVTSKELLGTLEQMGVSGKSASSSVPEDLVPRLRASGGKATEAPKRREVLEPPPAPRKPKPKKAAAPKAERSPRTSLRRRSRRLRLPPPPPRPPRPPPHPRRLPRLLLPLLPWTLRRPRRTVVSPVAPQARCARTAPAGPGGCAWCDPETIARSSASPADIVKRPFLAGSLRPGTAASRCRPGSCPTFSAIVCGVAPRTTSRTGRGGSGTTGLRGPRGWRPFGAAAAASAAGAGATAGAAGAGRRRAWGSRERRRAPEPPRPGRERCPRASSRPWGPRSSSAWAFVEQAAVRGLRGVSAPPWPCRRRRADEERGPRARWKKRTCRSPPSARASPATPCW